MRRANVVLLAGQSNAVGVGYMDYLPRYYPPKRVEALKHGFPQVPIWYFSHDKRSEGFVPTAPGCTERSKDTLGPEVGLAEGLSEGWQGCPCFILKCAVGGTSLWQDWLSPSSGGDYDPEAFAPSPEEAVYSMEHGVPMRAGWCYNELVKLTRRGLALLEAEGYTPEIRGFCWMQGEADACEEETLTPYGERFCRLLGDLRETLSPYMEECVILDAGISEIWPFYREMNALKERLATEGGWVYLDTIAHGLTTGKEPEGSVDIYHYDCGSTVELGRLFAEALLRAWT